MLHIREIPNKGRGVFAGQAYAPGEVLERAPVIVLADPQWEHLEATGLKDYYFVWDDAVAIALGCGSLYNHAFRPNAAFEVRADEKIMEFRALCAIAPGEEITINYNQGREDDQAPVWFETA